MKTLNSSMLGWLGLTLRDCLLCFVLLFLTSQLTFGQSLNYSTTVNSTSGPNYSVTVALELTAIVPVQNTCQWGYNYDVAYNYNVQINGSSSSLYTLAGYLTCGTNTGIYFDLPNNGGAGNGTTQGNPWTNNTDCATATLQSMQCASIDLQIEGPGIPMQTITLTPSSGNNGGGGTDWCTNGNHADSTNFIGTTNASPLIIRTNNEERMRISENGNIGVGVTNPSEKLEVDGNIGLTGDVVFSAYSNLSDTVDRFLLIDETGRTQVKSKSGLIQFISDKDCFLYTNGVQTDAPTWASSPGVGVGSPGVLYTGATCPARVGIGTANPQQQLHVTQRAVFGQRVGIGNTDPQARLHVKTNLSNPTEKLFLIERQIGNNDPYAVFQVTNDGLVRSREVKVDTETWPDYVFQSDYNLMPLSEVQQFIQQHGHLPNVPSAKEIEAEGLSLGETAKITMEKVEELTLYTIEQQKQLDEQKRLIEQQQQTLEEQRKLIEAQQKALEEIRRKF